MGNLYNKSLLQHCNCLMMKRKTKRKSKTNIKNESQTEKQKEEIFQKMFFLASGKLVLILGFSMPGRVVKTSALENKQEVVGSSPTRVTA